MATMGAMKRKEAQGSEMLMGGLPSFYVLWIFLFFPLVCELIQKDASLHYNRITAKYKQEPQNS